SSSHGRSLGTAIEESGTMRAIEGIQKAEQSALGKVGVQLGELGTNASTARRGLNAVGGAAAGGLAVAGTAYESYTVSSGYSRAKILYDAAANAKTDEEREMLMAEADRVYVETSEHAATSAAMLAAGAASPIVVGGGMVGYGSYQATRAVLENTETGRKIDRAVQDTMYDKMTKLDDLGRTLSGQDTVAEQERRSLSQRQDAWLAALRRGDIELQEGATVDDMLVLVERQEGRTASPQSDETLGDMRNVVKVVKPAPTRLVDGRELLGDDGEPVDELAAMMANAGDLPGGPGSWKDEGYDAARSGLDGRVYIDRFTGTSAAGLSRDEMDSELMPSSVAVAAVDKEDIAAGMQRGRDREQKENHAKARAQQMADKIYVDNWNHTLDQVNAVIAQQNENDVQMIAQKTQEAITMIQNVQNGTMSDADFSDKMRTLETEFDQLDQAGRQAWTTIVDRMVNDQLNPGGVPGILGPGGINPANAKCAGNFTMDAQMNFTCGCPGYTFEPSRSQCVGGPGAGGAGAQDAATQILTSVPADQIDQRSISCNDASKSGGDTPASITVAMGPGSGTANLSYNLYSVKDRIIAQYNGATIFDSGCTGGSQTVPIPVSGGGNVHIVVQPACAGKGTSWNFKVSCPGGQ
ncbi:MAG: hypothetical protein K8I00_05800, partial [Candidatus Omnitrophica bacterium]|nr:hypothetical protein [Candidatus Omnitrophota bacterium]